MMPIARVSEKNMAHLIQEAKKLGISVQAYLDSLIEGDKEEEESPEEEEEEEEEEEA